MNNMYVSLNEDGYFNDSWSSSLCPNCVEMDNLPEYDDYFKRISCKIEKGKWVFDENKYQHVIAEFNKEPPKQLNPEEIAQLAETVNFIDRVLSDLIFNM